MAKEKEQNTSFLIRQLSRKLSHSKISREQQQKILLGADISLNIIVVVLLVLLIRTFIMSPFQVYGISMCNTLNYINERCVDSYGDYIIINKSSYLSISNYSMGKPQRGDIVVFKPPQYHNEYYIKRIIGLPGETIKLIDGYVYIFNEEHPTGVKLDEPYLTPENYGSTFATGGIDVFVVPSDQYFVLGDNRRRSSDSRLCFKESTGSPGCGESGITPYLAIRNFEGKAALVLWPEPRVLQTPNYPELDS